MEAVGTAGNSQLGPDSARKVSTSRLVIQALCHGRVGLPSQQVPRSGLGRRVDGCLPG
jgi:hypothetical protein